MPRAAFQCRHGQSGTLWQGRLKSCLVQSDRYLLSVYRYIELNPGQAAMVSAPADHRWSSIYTHLGRAHDPLVTPHAIYLALGNTLQERVTAYAQWVQPSISAEELDSIRRYMA